MIDIKELAIAEARAQLENSIYSQVCYSNSLSFGDLDFSLQRVYLEMVCKYKIELLKGEL